MTGVFAPITMRQRDEFGDLANDFNEMSAMLQNNYSRLTAYSEIMTALNEHDPLATLAPASLQILCSHIDASVGALYLLDSESKILKLVSGYALQTMNNRTEYKIGEGIPGQCAAMKQPLEINNLVAAKDFIIDAGMVTVVPAYVLAAPVLFQENLIGVIVLGSVKPFDKHRREILDNSAPQIGVAITNARNLRSDQKALQ